MSGISFAPLRTALVGYGYWGPNLARNIRVHPNMELMCIVEPDIDRTVQARADYPLMSIFRELTDVPLNNIDAVVIATPPETHEGLSVYALRAGKHVLVEKPMTLSKKSANRMILAAEENRRTLMVDHVYCHSAAARKIKHIIDQKELGNLLYVDSIRINLGLFQKHCNVVWDLAVHDFSLIDYFYPALEPQHVQAVGTNHYTEHHDTAHINVTYKNSLAQAHIHVNWLSPVKVRQMIIAGTEKSIVWNDMDPVEPVKVYDSGATLRVPDDASKRYWQMEYRRGDIYVPALSKSETLSSVLSEFVEAVVTGKTPSTDARAGRRVVDMVSRADSSLRD